MRQSTKRTFVDLIRYIPSVIVPSLSGFIAVAVYTRLLPPEEYGLYALVFTTVMFAETFAFGWLNQSTLRYFERYRHERAQDFFSTCLCGFLLIALLITVVWFCIMLICADYRDHRLWKFLLIGPLLVFFDSGSNLMLTFLRAMRDSLRYSFQRSLNAIIKLAFGIGFILIFGFGAEAILLSIAIAGALVFFIEVNRLKKKWNPSFKFLKKSIFMSFANYGLPLVGFAVANLILSASDRYLIGYFMGSSYVGIYSAGYRIAETGVFLFVSFLMLASFPALIEAFEKEGEAETKALMKDILSFFLILLLPVVFGISILSEDIIRVVLGRSYLEAHVILPWISIGIFFMGIGSYFNKSFELKERTMVLLLILAGASFANIVLNILLIPSLGNRGAAISTCGAYFICFLLSVLIGSKFIKWEFPWEISIKVVLACIIMCGVIHILPDLQRDWLSLIYKVFIGFVVYLVSVSLFERKTLTITYEFVNKKKIL